MSFWILQKSDQTWRRLAQSARSKLRADTIETNELVVQMLHCKKQFVSIVSGIIVMRNFRLKLSEIMDHGNAIKLAHLYPNHITDCMKVETSLTSPGCSNFHPSILQVRPDPNPNSNSNHWHRANSVRLPLRYTFAVVGF